jgi:hypothetical protein
VSEILKSFAAAVGPFDPDRKNGLGTACPPIFLFHAAHKDSFTQQYFAGVT